LPEARRLYEQSLKLAREIGNQQITATVLLDLGQVLAESGDPTGARARYEEALGLAKQLADVNVIEDSLVNLGSLASRAGNFAAAQASFDEALALGRKHEHHDVVAAVLVDMSNLEEGRGNENKALLLARQGVEEARKTKQPALLTAALLALAQHEAQVGTFEASERAFDEIERLQDKLHNHAGLAATRTTRVGVLYGATKLVESEKLALSTLATIDAKSDPDDVGWLKLHLGKIHVQRKELEKAAQLFDEAAAVLATAEDLRLSVEVNLNVARVLAARGHIPEARAAVAKVRAEGVAMSVDETVRYADIVSAEISWKYGHDPAARKRLHELERTARAVGSTNLAFEAEVAAH
jgi:tetratricopeptide (TPR) repeat protein